MDAVIALHKPQRRPLAGAAAALHTGRPRATGATLRQDANGDAETRLFLRTTPQALVAPGSRLVVVAPHPDDEVLAIGGTVAALAALPGRGHAVQVVAVTDGEGSHPRSAAWPRERLRHTRPLETEQALARLGLADAHVLRLGLPDGGVAAHEKELAGLLPLRPDDTVFVTWRHDGHADHEACARATLAAARNVGARCIECPVWALVPGHPAHARLRGRLMQRIALPPAAVRAKAAALAAFASQTHADGAQLPVLTAHALAAWQQPHEWAMA